MRNFRLNIYETFAVCLSLVLGATSLAYGNVYNPFGIGAPIGGCATTGGILWNNGTSGAACGPVTTDTSGNLTVQGSLLKVLVNGSTSTATFLQVGVNGANGVALLSNWNSGGGGALDLGAGGAQWRITTAGQITALGTTGITIGSAGALVNSNVNMNNGAAANIGTLNNAPAAGNPTKWIPINDNGTTRFIPSW